MSDLQILHELETERAEVEGLLLALSEEIRAAQSSWQQKHSLRVRLSKHLTRVDHQISALQAQPVALAA